MEAVFLKLVNMSLTASWLALAVMAARLLFRKAPKWIPCLLWGLVGLRLLCPFSLESALSLVPSAEPLPREILYTAQPEIHSGIPAVDEAVNPVLESSLTPAEFASANPTQILSFVCSRIWVIGMAAMLLYTLVSFLLLKRRVCAAIPLEKGVKQSEFVDSPFVLGIFRPVIYLPFGLEPGDMAYVLAHERAHIRRRDHWWKPAGFLLLSVYWFNPVMWAAYILLCRDIEAACDEKVIRNMATDDRRAYSTALLNCSVHRRRIAACPIAFGEVGVKTRIQNVMNYKKPAFWVILAALLISIVIAVCFLTDPSGMHLYDIHDSRNYSDLLTGVEQIVLITDGQEVEVDAREEVLAALEDVQVKNFTLRRTRSENRDKTNQIRLKENTYLNFSRNYSQVWIDNGLKATYTYRVLNPENVRAIFERYGNAAKGSVAVWFDDLGTSEGLSSRENGEIQLPGVNGVTLRYTSDHAVTAESGSGSTVLMQGWPIWNVYFTDLSGDGIPEICATASIGFGLIDTRILVYDYAAGETYTLENRGASDYALSMENGELIVTETAYSDGSLIASGSLALTAEDPGSGKTLTLIPNGAAPAVPVLRGTYYHYEGQTEKKYYLTIPVSGVVGFRVVTPNGSGGGQCDDGYWYTAGETVYLEPLDGMSDLSGVCVTGYGEDGQTLFAISIPTGQADVINAAVFGECLLAPAGFDAHSAAEVCGDIAAETEAAPDPYAIECVDIWYQKRFTCLSREAEYAPIVSILAQIQADARSVPQVSDQVLSSQHNHFIQLNSAQSQQSFVLSQDGTLLWAEEEDGREIYSLEDYPQLADYLAQMTDGVRRENTSGTPFAGKDQPWNWTKQISVSEVEQASLYLLHETVRDGNTTSQSISSGIFSAEAFPRMLEILNAIPREAFSEGTLRSGAMDTYNALRTQLSGRGVSVSMIDRVNSLAVVFRYSGSVVEMALCDDFSKVENSSLYLKESVTRWQVNDPALTQYMQSLMEDPPIVNYLVGNGYEWAEPVEYANDGFSLTLQMIEGWDFEIAEDARSFGVRCRPGDVSDGWLYFSFWPGGHDPQEENRWYGEGMWMGYPSVTSYPDQGGTDTFDARNAVWSYSRARTGSGDFAVINEGADAWFPKYQEAIDAVIALCSFSVEE